MAATVSSGFVDNWQAGKTLAESNLRMLQEEDSCDVTFRCGPEGHVAKAHRYMLISRSCVFHAMLTGAMAEKTDVKIPDIEPKMFKKFLKYIYTDDINIDADNVTALLYTARKYEVTALETKCTDFLDRNLCADNACVILEASHRFDKKHLYEEALTLIKSQGERSLQSPGFLALSQVLVDEIVGSDDLEVDEHVIFTAVNDWSEAECCRNGREITPESKRAVLGGTLMKVRFPLLKPVFLDETVKKSNMLTESEMQRCLTLADNEEQSDALFSNKPRMKSQTFISKRRFPENPKPGSWKSSARFHALQFASNSDLLISGCQLYGKYLGKDGNVFYNVTSYFGDETVGLCRVGQDGFECTWQSQVFDVIFSRPVSVSAGEWYTLAVKMEGPDTLVGTDGKYKVVCDDGVEFWFRKSYLKKNYTNVTYGQIPSIIYRRVDGTSASSKSSDGT